MEYGPAEDRERLGSHIERGKILSHEIAATNFKRLGLQPAPLS